MNNNGGRISFVLTPEESAALDAVEAAKSKGFVVQARTLGLDPARSFRRANLRGVNLADQDLSGFDFSDADLSGADVRGADLREATLDGALLDGVIRDLRTRVPDGTAPWIIHMASHRDMPDSGFLTWPDNGPAFFGRQEDIEAIWQHIESRQSVVLMAPRRAGKTALLVKMTAAPHYDWKCVFVNVAGCATAADVLMDILNVISRAPFGSRVAKVVSKRLRKAGLHSRSSKGAGRGGAPTWNEVSNAFEQIVREVIDDGRKILLILDEFTMALEGLFRSAVTRLDAESLLNFLRHLRSDPRFEGRLQMIVTGSTGLRGVLDRYHVSASTNDLHTHYLRPWSNETARAYISTIMRLDPSLLDEIFKRIGDEPMPSEVTMMLHRLASMRGPKGSVTEDDIESAWQHMIKDEAYGGRHRDRLRAIFSNPDLVIAQNILARIAKHGRQSSAQLQEMLDERPERVQSILRVLREDGYLISLRVGRSSVHNFASATVAAVWRLQIG